MSAAVQRLFVAISIVLTLLGVAASVTTWRLKREVARLEGLLAAAEVRERLLDEQNARERTGRLEADAARRRERVARATQSKWPVFALTPGPPRPGTRSTEVAIADDDGLVILELVLPPSLTSDTFKAGLRSAPGDEFWMQSRLKIDALDAAQGRSARRVIRLAIPSSILRPADYELSLQPVLPAGKSNPVYYYFAVSAAR
jgi:hypothetical protein